MRLWRMGMHIFYINSVVFDKFEILDEYEDIN